MSNKDSYRYVPVNPNPAAIALGQYPESVPQVNLPHFERINQAEGWLGAHKPPQHVRYDNGITYGPNHEQVAWPAIQMVYTVEPNERKLEELAVHTREHAGLGVAGDATIDPSTIAHRYAIIHKDILHTKEIELNDAVPLNEKLNNEELQRLVQARGECLMKFQAMLERSGEKERELVDPNNKDVMKSIREAYGLDGLANRQPGELNLAEKTMQHVVRTIGEQAGARTVVQLSAIQAKFNEMLDGQDPSIPEAERVAVAMTNTLSSFSAQVPSRDAGIINSLQANIRGVVNELSAEQKAQDQSQHEIGATPSQVQQGDTQSAHDSSEHDEYGEYSEDEYEEPGEY